MMSYDKASPNAKIGCSNSNDPEFLEQLVREGKTNREIAIKKLLASHPFFSLWLSFTLWSELNRQTAPAALRYVQGGCAISKSHFPTL
jgi:hypothetical protein